MRKPSSARRELLEEMDGNSQIALLDSSDDAGDGGTEWIVAGVWRKLRIESLRIRPANAP